MVEVSNKHKSITVSVSSNNGNTVVAASSDTAQYWANQSHNFADQSKELVQEAKNYAELANSYIEGFEDVVINNTNNIIATSNDCLNQINTTKEEAVENVNSAKTTIINDIEFVADGEKKEIEELAENAKDDIKSTGFYMRDDKLYFINSKGEEEEFQSGGSGYTMFDTVLKDHVLTYEESKGLALQGTYVYKEAVAGSRYGYADFYNKCLEEKEAGTATEVTLGESTITMYVNPNGHQFYDIADLEVVNTWFNTYGYAWFYGVDTENERIFLPRNNWFEQATGDVSEVGLSVEAGLPNITGSVGNSFSSAATGSGVFASSTTSTKWASNGSGNNFWGSLNFNASNSNPIYNNSDTVQPNAVKKLLYICVGNTVADTSWVDIVTQVNGGVKEIEDKRVQALNDLNNKENAGISALANASNALRQTQITNCLLEVPQNIKLELTDGVLTLKAGSKVIVPNGFEADGTTLKFDEVVVEKDIKVEAGEGDKTLFVAIDGSYVMSAPSNKVISGVTDSLANIAWHVWYDTTNNIIQRHGSDAGTYRQVSFPFAITTFSDNTTCSSIDQVFNGIGYIGSTIWVDKGVKGLIPNGRNEDGTLNNTEFVTNNVFTTTVSKNKTKPAQIRLRGANLQLGNLEYDSETNYNYLEGQVHIQENIRKLLIVGTYTSDADGKVTSLQLKLPFRAVDYQEAVLKDSLQEVSVVIESYINGSSWYRIWSDGWCEQGGIVVSSSNGKTVTLLKEYKDTGYTILTTPIGEMTNDFYSIGTLNITTTGFLANWDGEKSDPSAVSWKTCGYIK